MSDPIKVGDLVVIVHWSPCGCGLGMIRTVQGFGHVYSTGCAKCNTRSETWPVVPGAKFGENRYVPLSWLKRIDPFPENEDVNQEEELTA